MMRALKYRITGKVSNGAIPVFLYRLLDRQDQVKVVYNDGTFVRYRCWACALKTRNYEVLEVAPRRVMVPRDF